MTTPFFLGDVDFDGVDPDDPQPWTPRGPIYLGRPDQQMIELPSPNSYTPTVSQGEVENGLAGGLSSVQIMADGLVRRYTLGWNLLMGRDQAVIDAFYRRRIFGTRENSKGPWAFVPPEDVNRLTLAQSLCGADSGTVDGWVVSSGGGTIVYQPSVAPAIVPGGTMLWTPAASSETVRACWDPTHPGTPDPLRSMPYLPAESCGFLWWAFTPSGTAQVQARVSGRLADGTLVGSTATGSTVTANATTPQPVYVLLDPNDLVGSQFMLPTLFSSDGNPVYASNPIAWYGEDIPDWALGCGVPRVTCPIALGDTAVIPAGPRPMQLVLSESIGRAA